MARFAQDQLAGGRKNRHSGFHFHSRDGFGVNKIQLAKEIRRGNELRQVGAQEFAELEEYALYLALLLELQFAYLVFELNDLQGLYESRFTAG